MPNLKLTYFDGPGRAEPIRIALFIAGIPFVDERVKFPQFMALKQEGVLPLGSVPVMEIDGQPITQTGAILRWVARTGAPDLYPSDAAQALIVDSALDTFNDTYSRAMAPSLFERDTEKKLAMRAVFVAGPMTQAFRYTEGLLARGDGPFLAGAGMSIGDLVVANHLAQVHSGNLDGIAPTVLEPYPRLRRLFEAYLAEPRIVAYRAK